jgi:hypothetical protein
MGENTPFRRGDSSLFLVCIAYGEELQDEYQHIMRFLIPGSGYQSKQMQAQQLVV